MIRDVPVDRDILGHQMIGSHQDGRDWGTVSGDIFPHVAPINISRYLLYIDDFSHIAPHPHTNGNVPREIRLRFCERLPIQAHPNSSKPIIEGLDPIRV